VVYAADCSLPGEAPQWADGEDLLEISGDNLDLELTPELYVFLGRHEAFDNLEGVRTGNRLFVVRRGREYLHCGYIMFRTRETRILGETDGPPLIGCCQTAPAARGRGLYRKALRAEIRHLQARGFRRAIISTHPDNAASRKGIEAAGFSLVREVESWILLNRIVVRKSRESGRAAWRILML
jgi:RimJ/RimL family protein N-acetyltransferase